MSTVDMKLEVVVIAVADVERSKRFYGNLGWRLDADFAVGDQFRGVQFTPPGSPCSIHFGVGITSAAPGSARGLYLVVSDIVAARAELASRGVDVGDIYHLSAPGAPPVNPRRRSLARGGPAWHLSAANGQLLRHERIARRWRETPPPPA